MEDEKTVQSVVAPIQALIIGTGDGGSTQQVVHTPAGQPNIVVTYITPLVALFVRFVDTFLTVLVATMTAGMTTSIIPAHDFFDLLCKCASLSVAGAVLGLLKDLLTVFTSLKQKFPLLGA